MLRDLAAAMPGGRRLHAELARANQRLTAVTAQLDNTRSRLLALGASRHRLRARRPNKAVLTQILPLRHAALVAQDATPRLAAEAHFLAVSPSYRRARSALDTAMGATPFAPGLATWWTPGVPSAPGIVLGRAHVSFEEILNSRELALGGVMVDIGANVGATSLPRVVLGDFSRVYAIEPNPDNYACLVRNIVQHRLEGLVLPDQLAISDTIGTVHMRRLSSGTHHVVDGARDEDAVEVPCSTLDAWVSGMALDPRQISFVKSDTQGWDVHVLLGAASLLRHTHIAWQMEFSPSMLGRAGHTVGAACEVIRSCFTHVIDMRSVAGPRVRRTTDLPELVKDLARGPRHYTNLLLYNAVA